jgi:putative dimethyl sulfoxide reductase chaperone
VFSFCRRLLAGILLFSPGYAASGRLFSSAAARDRLPQAHIAMNDMEPTSPAAGSMDDIYRFLALSMRYPESSWLGDQYLVWLFGLLGGVGLTEEAGALHQRLACGKWLHKLQVEHTRLFINGLPHTAAPPYGSVYLSGSLYGPSTERTRSFYRDNGYELAAGDEVPDSLERELEFLALLHQEGHSEEEGFFLRGHFRPWFGSFKQKVEEEASHPFYPAVVKLIDFFTREEN